MNLRQVHTLTAAELQVFSGARPEQLAHWERLRIVVPSIVPAMVCQCGDTAVAITLGERTWHCMTCKSEIKTKAVYNRQQIKQVKLLVKLAKAGLHVTRASQRFLQLTQETRTA